MIDHVPTHTLHSLVIIYCGLDFFVVDHHNSYHIYLSIFRSALDFCCLLNRTYSFMLSLFFLSSLLSCYLVRSQCRILSM